MRYLLFIAPAFALGSCATYMNEPIRKMDVITNKPALVIVNNDTLRSKYNKTHLAVARSKKPVTITTITDSIKKSVTVKPRSSFAYFANVLCTYGIGLLVEKNHPKRYTYPRRVYIDVADTSTSYFTYQNSHKAEFNLNLSVPYINNFLLHPVDESGKFNTGFWGISAGLDYYYGDRQFLNLSATGAMDFIVPVPGPVHIKGRYEYMRSSYLAISNNHKLNKFSFGYGLSYSINTWGVLYSDTIPTPPPPDFNVEKKNNAFGLIFSSYYQAGKTFNIGIVYRPTFYRPNVSPSFQYEHLLSLNLGWKIRL